MDELGVMVGQANDSFVEEQDGADKYEEQIVQLYL